MTQNDTQESEPQQMVDKTWLHASFGAGVTGLFAIVADLTAGEPFVGITLAIFAMLVLDFISPRDGGESSVA